MTEEIKVVWKELLSMKEDTFSRHIKEAFHNQADYLSKWCDSLKYQIKDTKKEICESTGKIVESVKQRGRLALHRLAKLTGVRKTGCYTR